MNIKIERTKLDFEERQIAERIFEKVIFDEDELRKLIYEYVSLKMENE